MCEVWDRKGVTMNRQSQFRVSAFVIILAVIFIAIVTLGSAGKQTVRFTADVTVKGGAITEGQNQTTFLAVQGGKCSIEASAEGITGLATEIQIYKDSSLRESCGVINVSTEAVKSNEFETDGGVYLVMNRKAQDGAQLADGTGKLTYTLLIKGSGGVGMLLLMILIVVVVAGAFLWMLSYETNKESSYSKKRLRMRGKAFMHAFFVMAMMMLAFALLDGVSKSFPFTTYQAGMISLLVGAAVFVILADRLDAYIGLSERRGQITTLLSAVAIVNLIVVLIHLFSKKTTSGTAIGNWIVNLVTAITFFAMVIALLTKKSSGKSKRSRSRESSGRSRSSARPGRTKQRPDPYSDGDVELYDANPQGYDDTYGDSSSDSYNGDDIDF